MGSKIGLAMKFSVAGGPSILVSREITVEAYDKIDVTVGANATDKEVEIQPGSSTQVQMLLIKSSKYGTGADIGKLKYKVHNTSADEIILDQEQLFLGQGAVGLLGANLDKLLFTNTLTEDVAIEILIGRDATP